jgi:hypothetical protein
LEVQTVMLQLLDQPAPEISAYKLMEFMLRQVLIRMHGLQSTDLTSQVSLDSAGPAYRTAESSSETTIAVTSKA